MNNVVSLDDYRKKKMSDEDKVKKVMNVGCELIATMVSFGLPLFSMDFETSDKKVFYLTVEQVSPDWDEEDDEPCPVA